MITDEQRNTKLILQIPDPSADRRLLDTQGPRSTPEAAALSSFDYIAEVTHFDRQPLTLQLFHQSD
jgi:hypothetical protein